MKVAVICEFSGVVRDAFTNRGHDAISFDLLPSESPKGQHRQIDIMEFTLDYWRQFDLAICHPPCTHLAVSGALWFYRKQQEQADALEFVRYLMNLPIDKICLENPVSVISTKIRKPDQIIQPWMFGHETSKTTCLWLKNLPLLIPTNIVSKGERVAYANGKSGPAWHNETGGGSGKKRSVTYQGIADAMAEQWH